MRLIDADALKQTFCAECDHSIKCEDCDIDYHFEHLAPTVDAVPVVRCNDCKYLGILNEKRIYAICNKHGKVFYLWGEDAREHYCSWGERREAEK